MRRIIGLIIVLLVGGCQSIPHGTTAGKSSPDAVSKYVKQTKGDEKKDSAPAGPPPTTFREVKVKHEPLSRYGNPSVYAVDGQRYNVLTTASGYRTRGLASWYGTKFHAKRTSSGEPYDMYALTAAHKTLPLPTYVRVKNLDNGRVITVKVNDRGPFHSARILDLSYGAAVKLGIFPKGTAHVEIEALTVRGVKNAVAKYYIQVGAFSSRENAEKLRESMVKWTPSTTFIEVYKKQYVVRVGPFATQSMSNQFKNILHHHGIQGAFSLLQ